MRSGSLRLFRRMAPTRLQRFDEKGSEQAAASVIAGGRFPGRRRSPSRLASRAIQRALKSGNLTVESCSLDSELLQGRPQCLGHVHHALSVRWHVRFAVCESQHSRHGVRINGHDRLLRSNTRVTFTLGPRRHVAGLHRSQRGWPVHCSRHGAFLPRTDFAGSAPPGGNGSV